MRASPAVTSQSCADFGRGSNLNKHSTVDMALEQVIIWILRNISWKKFNLLITFLEQMVLITNRIFYVLQIVRRKVNGEKRKSASFIKYDYRTVIAERDSSSCLVFAMLNLIFFLFTQDFKTAAESVNDLTTRPTDAELLELYALFKQGSVGDNNTREC